MSSSEPIFRILVADDNPAIHQDFAKVLAPIDPDRQALDQLLLEVLDDPAKAAQLEVPLPNYELDYASQGREAYEKALAAERNGKPFALIFMDVRMPPGWDGVETIRHIWNDLPHTEIVICTAFSDYSWEQILGELGSSDQLQFLRKPFDVVSVKQMSLALCQKWELAAANRTHTEHLESEVARRTQDLQHKIAELEKAMEEISKLRGILPMCSYCHKIRDDQNYWQQVDEYLASHTLAEISHGVCPDCYAKVMAQLQSLPKANRM
jgi:CheY-like chemotaxis protein